MEKEGIEPQACPFCGEIVVFQLDKWLYTMCPKCERRWL